MHKPPIDMTLRLGSEDVPLRSVMSATGLIANHLYIRGEPIATEGRFAGRLAERHYLATAAVRGDDENDVAAWLWKVIHQIEAHQELVDLLRDKRVEGVLWIALLYGPEGSTMPLVDPMIVTAASALGLQLFLENYTAFDEDGAPMKEWLPPLSA